MTNNVVNYVKKANYRENSPLSSLRDFAMKHDVPIVSDEVINLLNVLLSVSAPKTILELGSAIGYSAINFAMNSEACITTVELDEGAANIAIKNIGDLGYCDRITLVKGDADTVLDDLVSSGKKYDFIFIDAAKGQYLNYFKKCEYIINDGGIIFCDNILYKGLVSGVRSVRRNKTIAYRMKDFVDYVMENTDFKTTLLQSGDGVLISTKVDG